MAKYSFITVSNVFYQSFSCTEQILIPVYIDALNKEILDS